MNELVNLGGDADDDMNEAQGHAVISAETYVQIATAKRFRRSITTFRKNLQAQASGDMSIARQCHYAIPRAGKTIEGPSIRFAEMVLQAWGNAHAGTRIVAELDRFVVAQGVFYDLESNVRMTEEVQRRITNSKGERFDTDMIGVTGAAARSIALRNAILRGVPKALWWDGYGAARLTIVGDVKTMKAKRESAIAWFKTHGVTELQLFAALGIGGLADLGPDQLVTLAGFQTSIEDEGKDPEHLFPPVATRTGRTTPPAEPKQAAQNPGGASSPKGDADPVPQTPGLAASPGTQTPPATGSAAPPADQASATAPGPAKASAPVEAFTFPTADAALAWKRTARAELEACETRQQIKELRASPEFSSRLAALHEIDEDAAQGIVGLASDLAEALGDGDGR